jgi:hypothetical protein
MPTLDFARYQKAAAVTGGAVRTITRSSIQRWV